VSFTPVELGYPLLPPDPGIINPDLALDAALAPVVDLADPPVQPLGRGWAFDFTINQFVKNGISPALVYDTDELNVWIEKAMRTARLAYPIYTDDYGMEDPFRLIGQPNEPELVSEYMDDVIATLLVHDRIASVTDFYFSQAPLTEQLYVTFTVTLDATPPQSMQVGAFPVPGAGLS